MMLAPLDILWRPALAPLHVAVVVLVLAALAAWIYIRAARRMPLRAALLGFMRLIVILVLGAILLGPSVLPAVTTTPARPRLSILLDVSGSMLTQDRDQPRTRLRNAIDDYLNADELTRLGDLYDLRISTFDESVRAITKSALTGNDASLDTGKRTDYAQALTQTLIDMYGGEGADALLLIGDGHDSQDAPMEPAIALAQSKKIAIHVVAVGDATTPRDLALVALPAQEVLFTGEPGRIIAKIYQTDMDGASTVLHVNGPGLPGGAIVRKITFDAKASIAVPIPIMPKEPGLYEYKLRVEPADGETITSNNEQSVFVQVSQKMVKVLLLEGEPFWDTKFLAQSLRTDPRVELTQITQVSPERREQIVTRGGDSSVKMPASADALAPYDIVVLGRGIERLIDPAKMNMFPDYVARGGHIIFARGRAYDPVTPAGHDAEASLGVIEPVHWAPGLLHDQPLSLTPAGASHPAFSFAGVAAEADKVVQALPNLSVVLRTAKLKPATITLAGIGKGANMQPVIVTMDYGRGRVMAVLGEGLWRWSFLPPGSEQYRGVFDAFWSNSVRWLASGGEMEPGQQIAMKLGRSSVRLGDTLSVDVTTRFNPPADFEPKVTLTDPAGNAQHLSLKSTDGVATRMTATIEPRAAGVWSVRLDAPAMAKEPIVRKFNVYDVDLERLQSGARPAVMRDLAERTGGMFIAAGERVDLADKLERQMAAKRVPPRAEYVWDAPWLLATLLVWAGLEWIVRRQSGWL
ncbi:MAG: hypothetical protein GC162_18210 [Planctomycetes bacterium]|nr:hypothetical protein [Planctomycetota bacterium]